MESKKAFAVTPRDMLDKMKLEYDDFKSNPKSSRHAINFVLTTHHLKEWIWKSYLKDNKNLRESISSQIQSKESYHSFLNSACKEIKLVRELANNIKHFYSTKNGRIQETTEQKTWEEISCTWDNYHIPWGYEGLIIITKDNRWISALDVFQQVHDYWVNFFKTSLQDC